MTNPNPDNYSSNFKFDSAGELHQSIAGKLDLISVNRSPQDSLIQEEEDPVCSSASSSSSKLLRMDQHKLATDNTNGVGACKAQTTTTKAKETAKRKISFRVDDKNKIVEQVHEYPFQPEVPDEEVWWTDEELDKLLTEAMMVADHFTRTRKDWQNKIKLLLKGCSSKRDVNVEPIPLKASDLDFVVDSEARGLELYIHPIFQKNREKAIKGVVKVQEEYNACEQKKGTMDPELRLKVLKAQSLKLTQTARLMAKTLADGDARAAARAEEEDLEAEPHKTSNSITKNVAQLSPSRRGKGLVDLRQQNKATQEQLRQPGAGGINTLKATLKNLEDQDEEEEIQV